MSRYLLIVYCILFSGILFGQHQELAEKPAIWQGEKQDTVKSYHILDAFRAGKVQGHFRYFLSAISNKGALTDYYANAIGGGIRYETGIFHHFNMGISGFYIFNAGSSDLSQKDEASGQFDRYEIGLFDVTNPTNLNEINRLEEFFIKYTRKNTRIIFGRQLLNTPFINLQDGRMRPTSVAGVYIDSDINERHHIEFGYLYSIAPRSTSKWYSAGQSIGLYPVGVDLSGLKSQYAGNVTTKGVFIANYKWQPSAHISLNFWNMWLENVMNTGLLQIDWENKIKVGKLYSGFQTTIQTKSGKGGNVEEEKAYINSSRPTVVLGARIGWKNNKWDASVNANRINENGRYLMPREWGRDHFYTFMPRERNEGFGDVTALVGKLKYNFSKQTNITSAFGYFDLPDVRNYTLNKYGLPSYTQFNFDLRHKFKGALDGMEGQILWVTKINQGNNYDTAKYIIHKVDMHLLNVVLNFRF